MSGKNTESTIGKGALYYHSRVPVRFPRADAAQWITVAVDSPKKTSSIVQVSYPPPPLPPATPPPYLGWRGRVRAFTVSDR